MRGLGDLLRPALGRDELIRTALAQRVLRRWPQVVGPALAQRSAPDRYEKGTVWVAVEGSAWAQELRLIKPIILHRLQDLADAPGLFTDLRFGVRPFDLVKPAESAVPAEPPIREEDSRSIREIADDRLRTWKIDEQ